MMKQTSYCSLRVDHLHYLAEHGGGLLSTRLCKVNRIFKGMSLGMGMGFAWMNSLTRAASQLCLDLLRSCTERMSCTDISGVRRLQTLRESLHISAVLPYMKFARQPPYFKIPRRRENVTLGTLRKWWNILTKHLHGTLLMEAASEFSICDENLLV